MPPPTMTDPPTPTTDSLPTRRSLLSHLRKGGDDVGWTTFYDTYWRLIFNVARKRGISEPDAQEIVQDVLAALARKMTDYDAKLGSFKGWLMLHVRRRIADHWRTGVAQRHDTLPLTSNAMADAQTADHGFETAWDEEWRETWLATALERVKAQVNTRHYLVFEMSAVQGASIGEIARTLGMNAAQVYLARHRVGRLVKAELKHIEGEI